MYYPKEIIVALCKEFTMYFNRIGVHAKNVGNVNSFS